MDTKPRACVAGQAHSDRCVRVWVNWVPVDQIVVPFVQELAQRCVSQIVLDDQPWMILRERDWVWMCLFWPAQTQHCDWQWHEQS